MPLHVPVSSPAYLFSPATWHLDERRALCTTGGYVRIEIAGTDSVAATFDVADLPADPSTRSRIVHRFDHQDWSENVVDRDRVELAMPQATADWPRHVLEIWVKTTSEAVDRWNPPHRSAVKLTGLDLGPGGSVRHPSSRPRSVVFFGDSLTEGINTLHSRGDTSARSDSRLSWATVAADLLDAEVGVVGFGRQGLVMDGNGSVPDLEHSWRLVAAGLPRTFEEQTDVVGIAIGANDSLNGVDVVTFGDRLVRLCDAILTDLPPTTPLVLFQPWGDFYPAEVYRRARERCIDPGRVAVVETDGWWDAADSSDGLHPYGYVNIQRIGPAAAMSIRALWDAGTAGADRSTVRHSRAIDVAHPAR